MKLKNLLVYSVLLTTVACSGGRNSTGFSVINDMKYSKAAEAFTANTLFSNGQTMQAPVEGTVARSDVYYPTDGDGNPIAPATNPYEYDEYARHRGKKLYGAHCVVCHGEDGKGNGLAVERGFPKPPSFYGRAWKRTEEYNGETRYKNHQGWIFNMITFGRGNMASYAAALTPEDRWAISEYVRRNLGRKSSSMSY